ncbi:single-stranded DNA-binding protein [Herbiconiux liukaitaii]|uniref:single-stranded DNA-binding protein n=1 Tax=Herbiconiux liukaitaii TaxID=3342799 RepID=UPI0035B97F4F
MPDLLTLTGVVATAPRHLTTNAGLDITSFRLASSQRRYDKDQGKWIDGDTNWYTVNTFRQQALNIVASIERGQHVVVTGRLRIRLWESGEKSGTSVEIDADAVGHDLSWGTSVYTRSLNSPSGAPLGQSAARQSEEFPSSFDAGLSSGPLGEEAEVEADALLPF